MSTVSTSFSPLSPMTKAIHEGRLNDVQEVHYENLCFAGSHFTWACVKWPISRRYLKSINGLVESRCGHFEFHLEKCCLQMWFRQLLENLKTAHGIRFEDKKPDSLNQNSQQEISQKLGKILQVCYLKVWYTSDANSVATLESWRNCFPHWE